MREAPAVKLIDIEMALLVREQPFHGLIPALAPGSISVKPGPDPPSRDSSDNLTPLFAEIIPVVEMKEREGVHRVFEMRSVVDSEVGADQSMVWKAAICYLLPPFRGIISYPFAESGSSPEQAENKPGRERG
jgi:hypothetical protein